MILSRERALCPFRDDSLDVDESDEPLSEALESDEPVLHYKMNQYGILLILRE